MANRFWVGGTATWDATAGTKWATTSGGAGGAAIPTAADDVFFDSSSSGTITMSASSTGRSLDCNGFAGILQHPSATTISFGDATAGAGNRAFRLGSGMTYVVGNATTSILSFISTSATVQTITCAGKTVPSMTFNGVAGSWQLADTLSAGATATITLTNGTLDTNGQTVNVGSVSSNNSNTRTLTLGASTLNISGTATTWNFTTTTNLTFNANTSTINFVTGSSTLAGGGQTFNNIAWVSGTGGLTITGANTFNNVTFNSGSGIRVFSIGGNQTINGVFTGTGANINLNRCRIGTSVRGTTRTITMGASSSYSFTNVDFEDIAFAGTGLPITGTSLGDHLGNSNITFTPAVDRYWVGDSGSASDSAHWSATSGGAGGASVPLEQDNWFVDANSFTTTGQTLTMDRARFGKNADFTGLAFPITLLNGNQSSSGLNFFGNVTFTSNVTTSVTGSSPSWGFFGRGSQTITSAGANFNSNVSTAVVNFNGFGGTYTLQDNFSTNATIVLNNGTLNANGKNVTCSVLSSSNTTTRTLTMGSGTWTITGTGTIINVTTSTNLTFSGASATILVTDTSASTKTIVLTSGPTYVIGTLTFTAGGTGALIFNTTNISIGTFNCTGGSAFITFLPARTYTITTFNVSGTSGNLVTMASSTPGTRYTFSVASGLIQSSFVSLQDSAATGGAYFLAYRSTDAGNNLGWNFTQGRVAASGRVPVSGRVPISGRVAESNRYILL